MDCGPLAVLSPERRASNRILRRWCALVPGVVLSLGSGGDVDKEGLRYRVYFASARRYITSDIRADLGCDLITDARAIALAPGSVNGVFVSGVLEHVVDVAAVLGEIDRVLIPGGIVIVGVPFKQPIHRAPADYWRWTEYGVRQLLARFTIRELRAVGDPAFPFAYWAMGAK